jgi:hypothetical protein
MEERAPNLRDVTTRRLEARAELGYGAAEGAFEGVTLSP